MMKKYQNLINSFISDKESMQLFVEINKRADLLNQKKRKTKNRCWLRAIIVGILMVLLFAGGKWGGILYVFVILSLVGIAIKNKGLVLAFGFFAISATHIPLINPINLLFGLIVFFLIRMDFMEGIENSEKVDDATVKLKNVIAKCYDKLIQHVYGNANFGKKMDEQALCDDIKSLSRFVSGDISSIDDYFHINLSDNVLCAGADIETRRESRDEENGGTKINYSHYSIVVVRFQDPRFEANIPLYVEQQYNSLLDALSSEDSQMENQEFEKERDVYCEDPLFARMVITPAVMENFLRCKFEGRLKFIIYKNMILISKSMNGDMGLVDQAIEKEYYGDSKELCSYFIQNINENIKLAQLMNIDYLDKSGSLLTK